MKWETKEIIENRFLVQNHENIANNGHFTASSSKPSKTSKIIFSSTY